MIKEALLGNSAGYQVFQGMVSRANALEFFTQEYVKPVEGEYVLDLGCGPASIRPYLGKVNYTGIDLNEEYISHNRKKYQGDASTNFECADVDEFCTKNTSSFDLILLLGLIHHLSDEEAADTLSKLPRMLRGGGGYSSWITAIQKVYPGLRSSC